MQPDLSHAGTASDAFICVLIGVCISAAILWALLKTGLAWRLATDIPNDRSLHTRPTPRVGGWGVLPALALAIFLCAPGFRLIALCALLLGVISQIDDQLGLPAHIRFAARGRSGSPRLLSRLSSPTPP